MLKFTSITTFLILWTMSKIKLHPELFYKLLFWPRWRTMLMGDMSLSSSMNGKLGLDWSFLELGNCPLLQSLPPTPHCLGGISVQLTSISTTAYKVISSSTLATFLSDSWSWRMGSIDLHLSSVIQMPEMPFWPINIHDAASPEGTESS